MSQLEIWVDGECVSLTGTTKGDQNQREALRGTAWRWSRATSAWVLPRNLHRHTRDANVQRVKAALEACGCAVVVLETGAVQTEGERRAAAAGRLEVRADRYEERSARLSGEAQAHWSAERRIHDGIPFGQPILVGHHSQRRHERDLERIDRHLRKGLEAHRGAERLAGLAEGIRRELAATPLVTLRRRIERKEAEVRKLTRLIDGSGRSEYGSGAPATGARRTLLMQDRELAREALDLDLAELSRRAEQDGVKVWGPDDFVRGDLVCDGRQWHTVLRVNPKSLTIAHGFIEGATRTLPYTTVKASKKPGEGS